MIGKVQAWLAILAIFTSEPAGRVPFQNRLESFVKCIGVYALDPAASRRSPAKAQRWKQSACSNIGRAVNHRTLLLQVNERGKVSSRPGPVSPKQAKKLAEQRAAEPQPQVVSPQAAQPGAEPSGSASRGQEPASPATRTEVSSTPQVVVDRIFTRMVACSTIPVALGIALLVMFYFLKKQGGDDFPLWPAYLSQGITFGGGLLGITYGALSASWDPLRDGSTLGWSEFKVNLPIFLSRKQGQ
ncbi:hypothetical protein QJQ45_015481 [Haematococcus lacustris]|nr:hypothetical protein QJQ45_015481 [Haematococcus lacustris]